VGLPNGHAEAVDADLRAAALRELEEEAGLALAPDDVLGRLDELRPRSRRLPSVAVTPFVAWHAGPEPVEAGVEAADHFWLRLGELESPGRRTVLAFRRDGVRRFFPGVAHRKGVIWGLTFALLRRFLGLLPRAGTDRAGPAAAGKR
jgi:8-oxo-dGTP pyrophosphatase MutT (NUDIX family)